MVVHALVRCSLNQNGRAIGRTRVGGAESSCVPAQMQMQLLYVSVCACVMSVIVSDYVRSGDYLKVNAPHAHITCELALQNREPLRHAVGQHKYAEHACSVSACACVWRALRALVTRVYCA